MTLRLSIVLLASFALFAAIIFWPAGTIDWLAGWLNFWLVSTSLIITTIYLLRVNPEVIEHRLQFKKARNPGTNDGLFSSRRLLSPSTWLPDSMRRVLNGR